MWIRDKRGYQSQITFIQCLHGPAALPSDLHALSHLIPSLFPFFRWGNQSSHGWGAWLSSPASECSSRDWNHSWWALGPSFSPTTLVGVGRTSTFQEWWAREESRLCRCRFPTFSSFSARLVPSFEPGTPQALLWSQRRDVTGYFEKETSATKCFAQRPISCFRYKNSLIRL